MTASGFSTLFLLVVALTLGLRLWLSFRQSRHVSKHRAAVPAAFADRIPLDAHQKAADYTCARLGVGGIELIVETAFLVTLTLGGGLQWLYDLASPYLQAGGIWHGIAFLSLISIASFSVGLPFSVWRTFVTEARFGFNKTSPATFVSDLIKGVLVAAIVGIPLIAVVLWMMQRTGPNWWVWVWAFWLGFNLLVMVLYPIVIAPIFNKFVPLEDGSLKQRIEALLVRCGFRSSGLFVMDGSKRSAHGNAYFTGLGAAKRIVFFDTLIEKLAPEEVEAVLAHELGHFKLRHLWQRVGVMALMSLAILALLGWLMGQAWFFNGLGMQATGEAPALALVMFALPVFTFPLTPLTSLWSRRHEFQADAYAAHHARAEDLVSALVKLYRDNAGTLTPDPLYSAFYDSHPPAPIRVARLRAA
ncbi:M48 family metallopeptidase [Niveibacterium umoris]|uniref:STE24 endopeptidase n=1 Tax=Niveibacterium umoris TaxID=1193620 RepID=A0A840BBE9_9RHOO|nr:M48 family metallopeptidase [Niveibacterium umoris]MBB4010871.1 STE24 endopeptidase [Niveibacterium umoris]